MGTGCTEPLKPEELDQIIKSVKERIAAKEALFAWIEQQAAQNSPDPSKEWKVTEFKESGSRIEFQLVSGSDWLKVVFHPHTGQTDNYFGSHRGGSERREGGTDPKHGHVGVNEQGIPIFPPRDEEKI